MSQINAGIATSTQLSNAVRETKGDNLGKDDFLLLLVTQFKYQDPLNPMDDKEFVSQLSQFSSLEQLMNLNTSMEGLTGATKEQQMMNAGSYIGKDVGAGGNSIAVKDDKVSIYYYAFGETMSKGTINVYDQNMQVVYSETLGAKAAGTHKFEWNGVRYDGSRAPEGVYYVRLECLDANGKAMLTDNMVTGTVEGVTSSDGKLYLRLTDGRTVALSDVRELAAPEAAGKGTDSEAKS